MNEEPNAYQVTLSQMAQEIGELKLNFNASQLENETLRKKLVDVQAKLDEYTQEPSKS